MPTGRGGSGQCLSGRRTQTIFGGNGTDTCRGDGTLRLFGCER